MSRFQRTKDENFMIALYEMAKESGDFETSFDRYAVGERGGVTPKAVNAISKLLVQANFIKKSAENDIYLTPHGRKLVETQLIV
jgi:DNA-binding MarR family transcriptional regulator